MNKQSFLRGILAAQSDEPRSDDPRSILNRIPGWEEAIDSYDAGWDFWQKNKDILLKYNCVVV